MQGILPQRSSQFQLREISGMQQMLLVDPKLSTLDLLKLAADNHQKRVTLSDTEKALLTSILKERGSDELEYGQEIEANNVRLVKRVNGAVGIYYS